MSFNDTRLILNAMQSIESVLRARDDHLASIETVMRARHDHLTYSFATIELLPHNTLEMRSQRNLFKMEMSRHPNQIFDRLKPMLDANTQLNEQQRALIKCVLQSLIDERHYSAVYNLFGAVYVRSDQCERSNLFCFQNCFEARSRHALILLFTARPNNIGGEKSKINGSETTPTASQTNDATMIGRLWKRGAESYHGAKQSGSTVLRKLWKKK